MNAFKTGFAATDTVANVVALYCEAAITVSRYQTLFDTQTGTPYQVPAGKTLVLGYCQLTVAGAAAGILFGFGDTSVSNAVSGPTSEKDAGRLMCPTANVTSAFFTSFIVPAQKYPFVQALTNADPKVILFGVLV